MKKQTIEDLNNLKKTAETIALGAHKLGYDLEDVVECLNAIKPIVTTIKKSISRLENKGRTIPKQSSIKKT